MSAESKASCLTTKHEMVAKSPHIQIQVTSNQDKSVVSFKIKRDSHLKRLKDAYCEYKGVAPNTYRFLFDGKKIGDTQTPDELDMDEGTAEVDAMLSQNGGFIQV